MSKLFLLVILLPVMIFADQGLEQAKKKIAAGKASIAEYFLACEPCFLGIPEDSWNDGSKIRKDLLQSAEKKALYYIPSSSGSSKYENFINVENRLVDAKNGYLKISGIDSEHGVEYTGALFTTRSKKYFAWSFYHMGGDGDSYKFQLLDPSANWKDVTSDLMPKYELRDFSKSKNEFEFAKLIQWELVVPRYGTTAYLRPHPEYEVGEDERKYKKYLQYLGSGYAMELKWDKTNGKFVKGKILDQKEFDNAKK